VKLLTLALAEEAQLPARRAPIQAGLQLRDDEVHVWTGSLRRPSASWASLAAVISSEETNRLRAFRSAAARRRFLASRGQLRMLLGEYLRLAPRAIRLGRQPNGKLFVTAPAGEPPLCFNLSHSGESILYALTRAGAVGADVERFRPGVDWRGLAGRFFAPEEAASLWRAGAAGRAGFYRLWTRKEAMAKADGGSLFFWLGANQSMPLAAGWQVWSWLLPRGAAAVALNQALR
jgi:4'-phosphopantetheinyl transferase